MEADPITLNKLEANPGGRASVLRAEGQFTDTGLVVGIIFVSQGPVDKQVTTVRATLDNAAKKWKATLRVAPGNYTCRAVLVTLDLRAEKADLHWSQPSTVKLTQ
jgi:hypothetical protein